jgi:serpin B
MRTTSVGGLALLLSLSACASSGDGNGNDGSSPPGTAPATAPLLVRDSAPQTPASDVSSDSLAAAVNANNAMAVDLYAHVLADSGSVNLLTSPISASLALTMTYAGAAGGTATEMAGALHFDPSLGDAIFDGQNALSQALAARGPAALAVAQRNAQEGNQAAPKAADYDLHVVNSVWGEKTYTWQQPFLTTLAQSYGTGVYEEDFVHASEPARVAINDWVSSETNDKINDLLPQGALDDTTRLVLVNAMHLKFPWSSVFDPNATASASFTRTDGTSISASFMHQAATLPYVDDGQAQIVGLPLSNGDLSLVVALPHEGVALATYEATLAAGAAALSGPTSEALVELSLPKAEFTSPSFSLSKSLHAMGMTSAFDPAAADFSGLCADPPDGDHLYIGDVLQKAMISMQETGVEAAAATAVLVVGESVSTVQPMPVTVDVNRPYLVALVDNPTGTILMLGQIVDPTDAGSP